MSLISQSSRVLVAMFVTVVLAMPIRQASAAAQATSGYGRVTVTIALDSLRVPAVTVELHQVGADDRVLLGQTSSDAVGQVTFADVPPGTYVARASRDGFADVESAPFTVRPGATEQVLIEMRLSFLRQSVDVVAPANSPTESLQPVAVSDVLNGARMDIQPLAGDDFQSLLTVLPSVVRGPEGRLRIKGGAPTSGALQISSASLNDPSTGDFDLELPSGAVESIEQLANPFAAEYGRFSTSLTQIRTRRGTNEWTVRPSNLMPGFGRGAAVFDRFEPRLSISGPLKRDKLLLGQHVQYRFVRTPVQSLPDNPQLGLDSFDSFTRFDAIMSPRHALTAGVIYFPRRISNATLSTFRPPESTITFTQEGFSAGLVDRLILSSSMVLESTVAGRTFEIDERAAGVLPMVYAPQGQRGSFYNSQERDVSALQLVEALSISRDRWLGEHVFKLGFDLQHSRFDGESVSRQVDVVRLDGSLAERTTYGVESRDQAVSGTEASAFVQDRWRANDRLSLELGIRLDRDAITERVNVSPRFGMSFSILPEGRGILRGGVGKFIERTPLTVGAFTQYQARTTARFDENGTPLGPAVAFAHVVDSRLRTPESVVETVAWDQRIGRRFFFKAAYTHREGSHTYVLDPDVAGGAIRLSSTGTARYWEVETTGRYLVNERRDLTVSYVRSRGTRDLNDYDDSFGNFRNPLVRRNEHSLNPTDVPHRLIIRGAIGLPGRWNFMPIYEWRTGFPWSAVDEYQDFVGERNRSGRLPDVSTLDFSIVRPWRFRKYQFNAGVRVYNALGRGNERDVQANVTAPDYGRFYNPIRRSIGFVFSTSGL